MALSAAERMRRWRAIRRAAGMKPVVTWISPARFVPMPPLDLRVLQARSLALHVQVARKIEHNPALLEIAHRNLARWRERSSGATGAAIREWRQVLRQPWPAIASLLTEQSEAAVQLRQTTPFVGVLSRRERTRLYAAFLLDERIRRPDRIL